MSERKPYNDRAGYRASLKSSTDASGAKGWTVIYMAEAQDVDVGGCRYVVACEMHGTMVGETSMPRARASMKNPAGFCDGCRGEAGAQTLEAAR